VLPFQNMSGDPEQEYFADGIVEDIITALSRFKQLFVIARNSSFTYKGRALDVKQVGRELGVRYVLEGSVRKAAGRVRITGQLVETSTASHVWGERFDGGLEDIFGLQDQVTMSVVGAIAPKLEQVEIERAKRKPTASLDAYDCYLRAVTNIHLVTREANEEALKLLYEAIERDPNFAPAYGRAALCYVQRQFSGWIVDQAEEVEEGVRLERRAAALGREDAVALSASGYALAILVGELKRGAALIERALALNPNFAAAWHNSGIVRSYLGQHDLAIEHLARAMRLSPSDRLLYSMQTGTAFAHFLAGNYDEAALWAEGAMLEQPNLVAAAGIAAASNALAGRLVQAQKATTHVHKLEPNFRVSNIAERLPFLRPEDLLRYEEGLRKAGLPD